ncbi:DUF3265 domain-containing protein [Vibrio cholerae]|nr:DUF3265 domain-containing protein [Vibrio cholerae]
MLTKHLRVIPNARHFYHALVLVFKAGCGGLCIGLLTPQQGVEKGLIAP